MAALVLAIVVINVLIAFMFGISVVLHATDFTGWRQGGTTGALGHLAQVLVLVLWTLVPLANVVVMLGKAEWRCGALAFHGINLAFLCSLYLETSGWPREGLVALIAIIAGYVAATCVRGFRADLFTDRDRK